MLFPDFLASLSKSIISQSRSHHDSPCLRVSVVINMLESQRKALIAAACEIRKNAHAPYSKFHVGAALLTASGKVFTGCNVENASYGLTICAERSAVCSAIAAGEHNWLAMAVATPGGHSPCGACRQVLVEFASELPILLVDSDRPEAPDAVLETDMRTLLPGRFIFSK